MAGQQEDKQAKQNSAKAQDEEKKGFHLFKPFDEFFAEAFVNEDGSSKGIFLKIVRAIVGTIIPLLFRIEVKGKENIPRRGEEPALLVANHVSYFDPIAVWCATLPVYPRFLARANLWRFPVFRGALSRVGAIPVDPESADTRAIKCAANALKRGETVGIFAEGTRMRTPEKVYKPHAGFVLIANMGKAKIVPVGITGAEKIKPYGKPFLRFPKITVTFGEPIYISDYKELPKKERTEMIVNDTMTRVFQLRDASDPNPIRPGLPPYGHVDEGYLS